MRSDTVVFLKTSERIATSEFRNTKRASCSGTMNTQVRRPKEPQLDASVGLGKNPKSSKKIIASVMRSIEAKIRYRESHFRHRNPLLVSRNEDICLTTSPRSSPSE